MQSFISHRYQEGYPLTDNDQEENEKEESTMTNIDQLENEEDEEYIH